MLNHDQIKCACFLFVFCAVSASAQIDFRGGTILVTTLTRGQFTIAEDSRVRLGYHGHTDDDCKIVTLDNNVVFGFAGTRSFGIKAHDSYRDVHWEAHSTAREAYRIAKDKTAHGTAVQFAMLAKGIFDYAINSIGGWRQFVRQTGDAELPLAVFAGIRQSGEPQEAVVEFTYSPTDKTVLYKVRDRKPSIKDPRDFLVDGTDTNIVNKFVARSGLTFDQDVELRKWDAAAKNLSFDDRMSRFAVQLAAWQVKYMPLDNPTIGGPIDYVVITPQGGIADHRKFACRMSND